MAPSENTRLRLASIDGSELVLPHQNRSASCSVSKSKELIESVTFCGWRYASKDFMSWAHKLSKKHEHTWRRAQIFEAIMASTKKIHKDPSLIVAVAEKWCPVTNSFVFPWGEATITLEDVMVLLGFSVSGLPYFASLESSEEKRTKKKLDKVCVQIKKEKGFSANQVTWVSRFMDSGDELEHVAFLALWLSYFVFPSRYYHITEDILSIAVHLSSGRRIALAPAVLSHLYAELSLLRNHIRAFNQSIIPLKVDLSALFKLVQVWTWERFRELQTPKPMQRGDPRLALWHDVTGKGSKARQILENSSVDSFEWRPYTTPVKNWNFPQFYPEKAMWVPIDDTNTDDEFISYARCIRVSELVGIDCVEHYFPNRVASQFGMVQGVTCHVNQNHLSQEEAWKNYDKPIDDLVLYIPSRSTRPQATPRLCQFQWSSMENQVVESVETLTAGSEMSGPSNDGMNIAEKLMNKKRVREDDESCMVLVQTQVPSPTEVPLSEIFHQELAKKTGKHLRSKRARDDDVENCMDCHDDITVSKLIKSRKKIGADDSKSLGRRIHEEDNNDLRICQKLSSRDDETGAPQEIEPIREENDEEENRSKAEETAVMISSDENNFSNPPLGANIRLVDIVVSPPVARQNCGRDDEVDVNGTNAEKKKTWVDDGTKEVQCFVHEDGEMQRPNDDDDAERLKQINLATDGSETLKSGSSFEDSGICQKLASRDDEAVAPQEIEQRSEENDEEETGSKTGNKSSDPSNRGHVVPPPEVKQNCDCDHEVDVNGINAEKKTRVVGDGTKEAECLLHEDTESQITNEKEDADEIMKRRKLALNELALNLDARMMKAEETLAKIRERKTRRNQIKKSSDLKQKGINQHML